MRSSRGDGLVGKMQDHCPGNPHMSADTQIELLVMMLMMLIAN